MDHMDRDNFLALPAGEVAKIVRGSGSKVCVFPFNGTRRWFLLEYGRDFDSDAVQGTIGGIQIDRIIFDV